MTFYDGAMRCSGMHQKAKKETSSHYISWHAKAKRKHLCIIVPVDTEFLRISKDSFELKENERAKICPDHPTPFPLPSAIVPTYQRVSGGARSSDYLFHPEHPRRIDMAVPPLSASVLQQQYVTTIGVVKYLMKYVIKPPVRSIFTRGGAHVHMLLNADFYEEDDDINTDAIDVSSISSNDDDIPALVER